MRHEPTGMCPPIQQTADRRCPSCRTVIPLEDFPARAGTPADWCGACRRCGAAVARRHQQRTPRQITRRAEAGYRALLARHTRQGGGGDAA
jgi:hypothetical protein